MSDQIMVRRYAQALYDEAGESVLEDMARIRKILEESRALRLCLASPVVASNKKLAVLEAVLISLQVREVTLWFVRLLTQRRREALLLPVTKVYREIRDECLGITRVDARVRFRLADQETDRIRHVLEEKLATRVHLTVEEDESLIGGMVLRIGDVVYDGSIAYQLEQLRSQINRHEA